MKSFLSRALTGVVLLSSSVLVFAQPAITSFDGFQGRLGPARMTPLSEYSTSPYGYRQGVSTDRSEYGLWRSPGRYRNPGSEHVVSCSALGCPNNPPDPNRTPVVELPDGNRIDLDLVRRLKDEEPPVKPRVKPKTEHAARNQFYRNLHRHADGRGSLDEVEEAYRDLVRFRR